MKREAVMAQLGLNLAPNVVLSWHLAIAQLTEQSS